MVGYTAWDSLHALTRQYDADLTIGPDGQLAMSPRTGSCLAAVQELAGRVRAGLDRLATSAGRK